MLLFTIKMVWCIIISAHLIWSLKVICINFWWYINVIFQNYCHNFLNIYIFLSYMNNRIVYYIVQSSVQLAWPKYPANPFECPHSEKSMKSHPVHQLFLLPQQMTQLYELLTSLLKATERTMIRSISKKIRKIGISNKVYFSK